MYNQPSHQMYPVDSFAMHNSEKRMYAQGGQTFHPACLKIGLQMAPEKTISVDLKMSSIMHDT